MATEFTPLSGLIGGLLIGLASVLLLLTNGRIAGISGILAGLLLPVRGDTAWRLLFVLGLVLGGAGWQWITGEPMQFEVAGRLSIVMTAGFLVGFGTRMGGGCTSGHGVCGLARRSKRSIVATLMFMGTAMLTVMIVRHLEGF